MGAGATKPQEHVSPGQPLPRRSAQGEKEEKDRHQGLEPCRGPAGHRDRRRCVQEGRPQEPPQPRAHHRQRHTDDDFVPRSKTTEKKNREALPRPGANGC